MLLYIYYIYTYMKTMCCPGYLHKPYIMCPSAWVATKPLCIVLITGRAHCFHDCIYIYIYIYIAPISLMWILYIYIYYIYIYIYILNQHFIGKYAMQCSLDRVNYIKALSRELFLQCSSSSWSRILGFKLHFCLHLGLTIRL